MADAEKQWWKEFFARVGVSTYDANECAEIAVRNGVRQRLDQMNPLSEQVFLDLRQTFGERVAGHEFAFRAEVTHYQQQQQIQQLHQHVGLLATDRWVAQCRKYAYYSREEVEMRGSEATIYNCVTPIRPRFAASTRHNHSTLEIGDQLNIYGDDGHIYKVRVHSASPVNLRDIILFENLSGRAFHAPSINSPQTGQEYLLLGYGIYGPMHERQLNALVGHVTKTSCDEFGRFLGAYGAVPGFSGGGVFTRDGQLLGICRGSKDHNEFFSAPGRSMTDPGCMAEYAGHASMVSIIQAPYLLFGTTESDISSSSTAMQFGSK